ncbi:thiamine transporter 1-like isoform X2 [Octopus vulgaris]|uniref:Thiamine transporter 1-like isoform X2 n=1 Tax=Octopus vulgaris TaxID=6645 RepID=A0AA36F990_OCTVU|nr:thiamine transporter 1-like isoform X2 [Octopus vulgaris]
MCKHERCSKTSELLYRYRVNVCIAFVISIFLPKVEKSFYFHKQTTNQSTEDIDLDSANYQNTINSSSITQLDTDSSIHSTKDDNRNNDNIVKVSFKDGIKKMARDFIRSYSHHELLIWSFWWAMDSCGNLQLGNYIQNLWIEITPNRTHTQNYNGAVDAASMALTETKYRMKCRCKDHGAKIIRFAIYQKSERCFLP